MADLTEKQKEEGWALLAKNNLSALKKAMRNFNGGFRQGKKRALKPRAKNQKN